MGCNQCGGASAPIPYDPNRGIEGSWSVRWPHGALQKVASEAAGQQLIDSRPDLPFLLLPPVEPTSVEA